MPLRRCHLLSRKAGPTLEEGGKLKRSQGANCGPCFRAGSRHPCSWAGTSPSIFRAWERYYLLPTAWTQRSLLNQIRRSTHLSLLDHQPTSHLLQEETLLPRPLIPRFVLKDPASASTADWTGVEPLEAHSPLRSQHMVGLSELSQARSHAAAILCVILTKPIYRGERETHQGNRNQRWSSWGPCRTALGLQTHGSLWG